jgi:conjugative relaxase-like TrwC/TraI family protein
MLSIAKLRVGQEAYHLSGVAQSLDDYYTGAGESVGQWLGGSAARLGMSGEVSGDDLRAVLAGLAPGTGGLDPNGHTLRTSARRVPGFDLTFKLPKSASVLYAVSDDPRVQGAIIDAGETAMCEAVAWLEREAIRAQRGSHDKAYIERLRAVDPDAARRKGPRRITTHGVVAAGFRHRTSRAGDPLLHWHVLVANLVEGNDGRWSAFAHPEIYRSAKTAGQIFQAVARRELTASLGVDWVRGRHVQEIAGIPGHLIDVFSKRRAEIESWLVSNGRADTRQAAQEATLATRRGKPEREGERLDAGWKREAIAEGWGPDQAEALIDQAGQTVAADPVGEVWRLTAVGFDDTGADDHYERTVEPEEWIADLLRRDLTHTSTTFTRFELTEAVAARIGTGATVATIDRVVARVLASDQVVAVHEPNTPAPRGRARYTSRDMLAVEQRLLAAYTTTNTHPPLPADIVETAIAERSTIGDDQAAAVRTICAATGPVAALVGPAGTGKTFTLDTVRDAYHRAGYHVIGAAPSARAAIELHAGANIPSRTLHSLLAAWERGHDHPSASTVLVIDEAGMTDVRLLERSINLARQAGGRVVLVGDHHQLPEIDAGGGFAAATQRTTTVAELTVNRRQHEPWEQDALAELRAGNITTAVRAYLDHDRVVVADSRQAMVDTAIDQWAHARGDGRHVVLLAGTNELVDVLNDAARRHLVNSGELAADLDGYYGHRGYRVGERIVLRRNSDRARTVDAQHVTVANGQTGTITGIANDTLSVLLDQHNTVITLGRDYLAHGGHVDHAYALTTTRAQGGTWEQAITVGLDGLYRQAAYVDMSRGQHHNLLVITRPEAEQIDLLAPLPLERHDQHAIPLPGEEPGDLDDELVDTFERSRAKHLAHTIDPHVTTVDDLAQRPLGELEARFNVCRRVERLANEHIGIDVGVLCQAIATASRTATHAAVGQTVRALDRHNIGIIIGLDDTAGEVLVAFVSADGKCAERSLAWQEVELLDEHATPRSLPDTASTRLAQLHQAAEATLTSWTSHLADHGVEPGEADTIQRAIRRVIERATNTLIADQPQWLTTLVGYQPTDPIGTQTWTSAVREIARWQTRHHHTSDDNSIPPEIGDVAREAWEALSIRLVHTKAWLDHRSPPTVMWPRRRSHAELVARRDELDQLLDTAPPDQQPLITRLRRCDPQLLDDTAETLKTAIDTQRVRRHWILEHWPHIVEYAEITNTLTHQLWGPDTTTILGNLTPEPGSALEAAIAADEPWLPIAIGRLAAQWTEALPPDALAMLYDIAEYRIRWGLNSDLPVALTSSDPREITEVKHLLDRISSEPTDAAVATARSRTSPLMELPY